MSCRAGDRPLRAIPVQTAPDVVLPGPYICPRCHSRLTGEKGDTRLLCRACAVSYPVVDGVPYLVFEGSHWARKLRELVLYHVFYQKIKTGRLERDRLAGKEEEA